MNAESMQALESGYYQLHRELAEANETIGNLRNDLTKAQARIAELEAHLAQTEAILVNTQAQRDIAYQERAEAQQWQQLVADEVHERIGKTIRIENEGRWIELEANDERIGVWLDDFGCAVFRKMRPAE
ncbi:MAG: hypothetical protein E6Q97_15270 [Desulfurellales bacterium]|nr:MAG: hypothetical protein E6Q97_15270 [Desulfurellales bacterium]